jgi:hypothetical protein
MVFQHHVSLAFFVPTVLWRGDGCRNILGDTLGQWVIDQANTFFAGVTL